MPIRMTHPDHGATHAVGAEVDWNKKHGWVESLEVPVTHYVEQEIPDALKVPEIKEPATHQKIIKTKTCLQCGKECKNLGAHMRFCKAVKVENGNGF